MRKRSGFTLVELMVAMALTIFIMVILTQAFILSIDTFVGLKGIGDMQDNLRAAGNAIRFDLAQNHFEGARRPSDPTINNPIPSAGFMRIYQGAASTYEGQDLDGMPSSRAAFQVLHFSSRLKGNQQQSFYTAPIPDPRNPNNPNIQFFDLATFYSLTPATGVDADATLRSSYASNPYNAAPNANAPPGFPNTSPYFYRSQWAEIAYFVGNGANAYQPIGTTEEPLNPNGAGLPLYGLYRAQYVAVTDNTAVNAANFPTSSLVNFAGIACNGPNNGNLSFYGPHDFAKAGGASRTFNPANAVFRSASLVVPNVLSFQVQGIRNNSAAPNDMSYDSANGDPPLLGVSINIRVWDNKTRQARQITITQDL